MVGLRLLAVIASHETLASFSGLLLPANRELALLLGSAEPAKQADTMAKMPYTKFPPKAFRPSLLLVSYPPFKTCADHGPLYGFGGTSQSRMVDRC